MGTFKQIHNGDCAMKIPHLDTNASNGFLLLTLVPRIHFLHTRLNFGHQTIQSGRNKPKRPTVACYITHNYTTSYDRTSYYITFVPKKVTF